MRILHNTFLVRIYEWGYFFIVIFYPLAHLCETFLHMQTFNFAKLVSRSLKKKSHHESLKGILNNRKA
jgi:hypothetical protein